MDFNADLFSVDRPVAPQPVSAGHMVQALERPLPLGAKIISVGKDNGSAPAPWTGPRAVGVVVSRFRVERDPWVYRVHFEPSGVWVYLSEAGELSGHDGSYRLLAGAVRHKSRFWRMVAWLFRCLRKGAGCERAEIL